MGKKGVMRMASSDTSFDWKASHPKFGSAVHAILFGGIVISESEVENEVAEEYLDIVTDSEEGVKQRLDLLRLAVESGANAYVVAPESCTAMRNYSHGPEKGTPWISFAGKTAIECLLSAERAIRSIDGVPNSWEKEITCINDALNIIYNGYSSGDSTKVLIHEQLVEMWGSLLSKATSSDVAISAMSASSDVDSEDKGVVYAHRVVLCEASPVLSAMLAGTMIEGSQQKIVLDDCSLSATKMLLALLYAGSLPEDGEPKVLTLIECLMLAHRWQVQHVVAMLSCAIAKRVDFQHFEAVFASALRLEEPVMLSACKVFITSNAGAMKAKLTKKGALGFQEKAVAAEVSRTLNAKGGAESPDSTRKRRRVL